MLEFLLEYGLFLAKTLTFVVAILVVVASIMHLRQRHKTPAGTLFVIPLHKKLVELVENVQEEILDKPTWKQWQKKIKKGAKERSKTLSQEVAQSTPSRIFVVRFEGDLRASHTQNLRECITAILSVATDADEVFVILESAGGLVSHYGLAASQLERIRAKGLPLTVGIDKCAASGGYLMACVADKIIAAPFAIIGSIGVVAQLPNFHRLLQKNHIDFELHTAGDYKRTLTLFGENTNKGREKLHEELEETHQLFKEFIATHRPSVDLQKVATGEHWYGTVALKMGLVDQLMTSDDYLLSKLQTTEMFEFVYEPKQSFSQKLLSSASATLEKNVLTLLSGGR